MLVNLINSLGFAKISNSDYISMYKQHSANDRDRSHCIYSTSRSLSYISVSYIMSIIQKSVGSHANSRFDISFYECWCRNLDTLCRFDRVSIHAHYSCKLHIRILDLIEPNFIKISLDYHDSRRLIKNFMQLYEFKPGLSFFFFF